MKSRRRTSNNGHRHSLGPTVGCVHDFFVCPVCDKRIALGDLVRKINGTNNRRKYVHASCSKGGVESVLARRDDEAAERARW